MLYYYYKSMDYSTMILNQIIIYMIKTVIKDI